MTEVANQSAYAVLGLKEIGVDATSARWFDNYGWIDADYCLNIDRSRKALYPWYGAKMLKFFDGASKEFDVFHFHAGRSLLPRCLDLARLNRMGKSYYFEYHGSELRQGEPWARGNPFGELLPQYKHRPELAKRASDQLAHAAGAIVHDAELAMYEPLQREDVPLYFAPLRIDPMSIEERCPDPVSLEHRKPLVVHAPSNPRIKGSEYVVAAVEALQQTIDFDFKLITGMSRSEALDLYSKADIVIDQLLIGTYGVFALEAMLMGKPVLDYIRDDIVDQFPSNCPIVKVTKDTIKNELERLLRDPDRWPKLGHAGRTYVEMYHDYRNVAKILELLYRSGKGPRTALEAFSLMEDFHKSEGNHQSKVLS